MIMPTTLILFVIFALLCLAYGYTSKSKVQMQWATEAGSVEKSDSEELRSYNRKVSTCFFMYGNQKIDSSDYVRIEIHGTCMTPRGICNNEHWLVKPIDKSSDIRDQIKTDDVLLLYLADKDEYKIREFRGYTGEKNDLLDTYRYSDDGGEVRSSCPHSFDKVVGVVTYKI